MWFVERDSDVQRLTAEGRRMKPWGRSSRGQVKSKRIDSGLSHDGGGLGGQ